MSRMLHCSYNRTQRSLQSTAHIAFFIQPLHTEQGPSIALLISAHSVSVHRVSSSAGGDAGTRDRHSPTAAATPRAETRSVFHLSGHSVYEYCMCIIYRRTVMRDEACLGCFSCLGTFGRSKDRVRS